MPGMDLEIEFTDEVPSHMLIVTVTDEGIRIRCSVRVDVEALSALQPEIAARIVYAIEQAQ
jgi:hypothetical protein